MAYSPYPTGLGNDQQATQATAAMRAEPWYQQWLASKGIQAGPDQQVKLNSGQQEELRQLAIQHGIGLNNKYDQIDENGQISEAHHKLRDALVGAGIGAAALTGLGAAGIGPLTGLLGGGAAATGGGGTLEGLAAGGAGATSVPVGSAALLAPEGGLLGGLPGAMASLPAATSAGLGAGLGGVEAGASSGVSSGLPGAMSSLPSLPGGVTLPDWLKSAKDIGSSLQSYGYGRALGRVAEGEAQQGQARTADELYNSQLSAPGKIAHNSVKGDILSRAQDVSIAAPSDIPVPTISGGLRPSMFSPTTRATGAALTQNASQDAANLRPAVPPTLPDLQGANGLDSVLNTAGLVSNIAGSVPKNIWSKIFGS